jgi:hypothetical protein
MDGAPAEGAPVPPAMPPAREFEPARSMPPAPRDDAAPPPRIGSFDFERVPERVAVDRAPAEPASLPIVRPPHDVQEWTPTPSSDATREAPRNEP